MLLMGVGGASPVQRAIDAVTLTVAGVLLLLTLVNLLWISVPWFARRTRLTPITIQHASIVVASVALLIFFGLLRPGMRAALGPKALPQPGTRLDAIADDSNSLPALPAPAAVRAGEHIESARQMARANPAAVAGILRNWVDGSQTAASAR